MSEVYGRVRRSVKGGEKGEACIYESAVGSSRAVTLAEAGRCSTDATAVGTPYAVAERVACGSGSEAAVVRREVRWFSPSNAVGARTGERP